MDPKPDSGETPFPPLRARGGLAARIVALVMLVVVGNGLSAIAVHDQVRGLRSGAHLSTVLYIFNERLQQAEAQSARIAREIGRRGDPEQPELRRADLQLFREALEKRMLLLADARHPLDEALAHPERVGGQERLEAVRELLALVHELEALVAFDEEDEPTQVRADVSRQNEIQQLFHALNDRGEEVLRRQRARMNVAWQQTLQFSLIVTIVVAILSLVATLTVILTLRPLRRLTQSVRRLASGDWSQRIEISKKAARDDEVRRLAREFNHMAAALQERERRLLHGERLAAVGRLASQITHEIRNPLSSLALNAELLVDEIEDAGEDAQQLVNRISAEVDRLTAITEDYLAFSRQPKPELNRIDLAAELGDLLDFLAEEHEQAGIEVQRGLPEQPLWIDGDANQLRQAFLNLLRNAQEAVQEAMVSGDGAATIRVELSCKDGQAQTVVADSGQGIDLPPERLDRIFEAFFTRKPHGTGLGLPMVQQIAVEHGGTVRLLETGPQGTRFLVTLPTCDASRTNSNPTPGPASTAGR